MRLLALRPLALLCGLALLATMSTSAQTVPVDTETSQISYKGSHFVHSWTGVSNEVTGSLTLDLAEPANSQIEIVAPVESFDSGNGGRDRKMAELVETEVNPNVRFVSNSIEAEQWDGTAGRWIARGDLTFHGLTFPAEIPVDVQVEDGQFVATGSFEISLDQYEVERPKLLLAKIRDTIELDARVVGLLEG